MQSAMDSIRTRARKVYLSHPFMWRFENLYDNIVLLIRGRMVEDFSNDPLVKTIRDIKEEERISKKYDFAKDTVFGYRMTRGIPIEYFPDSEFEERYAARKLRS